jgi:hypothetical protein
MANQSKSVRILDLIALSPGMRFSDIQKALWHMTYPPGTRPWEARGDSCRGYWCTNLLGGMHYHAGLLRFFCTKGADGLWRRNNKPHQGKPWRTMGYKRFW